MVRDIGSIKSSGVPKYNTFVYSLSGLRIQEAIEQSKTVFADHCDGDIAVLQLGTPDIATCPLDELIPKYKI